MKKEKGRKINSVKVNSILLRCSKTDSGCLYYLVNGQKHSRSKARCRIGGKRLNVAIELYRSFYKKDPDSYMAVSCGDDYCVNPRHMVRKKTKVTKHLDMQSGCVPVEN